MIKKQIQLLIQDERGNVLFLLAFFLISLVLGVALAVDIGKAQVLRARMQAQVDSAALAVGLAYNKDPSLGTPALTKKANDYFAAGFPSGYFDSSSSDGKSSSPLPALQVDVDGTNHTIKLTAQTDMPTIFPHFNVDNNSYASKLHIKTESTVLRNVITPTEIVLALDITGSMGVTLPKSGDTKYRGLYDAANNFLDIFAAGNTAKNIYIGIVPYTQTVNIGLNGVASFPLNGLNTTPTWNEGNKWMDGSDPSLSANYDWGDKAGVAGYDEKGNAVAAGWNRIGNSAPYGWGGCVMARRADVNGPSKLPLDISDDNPATAPFQRFYYPSDNWRYVLPDPNDKTVGNSDNWKTDMGCGFAKQYTIDYTYSNPATHTDAVPEHTDAAYTDPAYTDTAYTDSGSDTTTCLRGEGGCTTTHTPGVYHPAVYHPAVYHPAVYHPFTPAKDTPASSGTNHEKHFYESFRGYNPWICRSTVSPAEGENGNSYFIFRTTNNFNIYKGVATDPTTNSSPDNAHFTYNSGPNYTCPLTRDRVPFSIFPLESANDSGLKATIENIRKIGNDASHEFNISTDYSNGTTLNIGLAWSWRLISERWAGLWNDGVDAIAVDWRHNPPSNIKKYVVIMTDGKNNTVGSDTADQNVFGINSYTAYGVFTPWGVNPSDINASIKSRNINAPDETYLNNKTLALCKAMGDSGIIIFTVGFGTVGTGTNTDVNKQLLTDCAGYSSTGGGFLLASDNASLKAAFQNIADQILRSLRVTN